MALYGVLFLTGYLLASDARFWAAIKKLAPVVLSLAPLTLAFSLWWLGEGNPSETMVHDQLTPCR
jgi:hypothetical protein